MIDIQKCYFCEFHFKENGYYCSGFGDWLPCFMARQDENFCGERAKKFKYDFPYPKDCTGCTVEIYEGNASQCTDCKFNPQLKNKHTYKDDWREQSYLHSYDNEDNPRKDIND